MPIDLTNIPQDNTLAQRYRTAYDEQLETLPTMSLSAPRSKYDPGYVFNPTDPEGALTEQRAQEQSGFAKLGLGMAKAGVLTGTTAADGIIGTALGLVNMAGQQKGSAMWDNPFSNLMNDINNKADEWMPIYQTKASKNAGFIGQMGYADFWGDKFLKNLGFTAGMILDGIITGGVSNEILGAKAIASKLPTAIAEAAMDGSKALGLAVQTNDGIALSAEVIKNANKLANINRVSQGLGLALSTQGEARFEAVNNSTDFYNKNKKILDEQVASGLLTNDQYIDKLKQLSDAKDGMGNADFLANLVILGVSNGIQFKNLFTRGFNPNTKLAEGIAGSIEKDYTYSTPVSKYVNLLKNPLAEGIWEEQGQYTAQQGSEDFYQRKFDGKKQDSIDDVFHSLYKGLSDAYGTREGWDQGLIGSLTGAIGLPTIARSETTGHPSITWASGIVGKVNELHKENEFNKTATDRLNETIKSPSFQNNYQGLIRNMSLEDEKLQAAANGDKYEVLNKEHEQFINDALTFIKAGKYEDFVNNIEAIKNSNAEEVKQLFKKSPKTVEDNIREFYGLLSEEKPLTEEQKVYADVFKVYTSKELIDKIHRNANTMIDDAKNIRKLYNSYSTLYPNMSEEVKEKLVYFASNLDNVNKRINDINKESLSKFGVDINDNVNITEKEDRHQIDISEYLNKRNLAAKQRITEGTLNPTEDTAFRNKLQDLPKLLSRKVVMLDAYKRFTTNKGLLELEKQVEKDKKDRENITAQEAPTTSTELDTTIPQSEIQQEINSEPQYLNESVNDNENNIWPKSIIGRTSKGVKDVSTSISFSHWDATSKKTVVRNEDFNDYTSSPSNNKSGDKVSMSIDTSTEDPYLSDLWKANKKLKDRLDLGTPLTKDEVDSFLNNIKTTQGTDNFKSLIDVLPIKINYTTKDGRVFDKGLYYHDSNYENIFIPNKIKDKGPQEIKAYIRSEKEKTRSYRKSILHAILSGKSVTATIQDVTRGIPNNTGTNRNISEVLNVSHNDIKLGIADSSQMIWTGDSSSPMIGYGAPGNIFFETNKTANGNPESIKLNVQKISKEHAEILWNAILTRFHPHQKGYNATVSDPRIEGLTAGEVVDLLTNFGQHTNLENPKYKNKLGEYLRDKQLFLDSNKALHYGNNIVKLVGGVYLKRSGTDIEEEKKKFINWATKNKNYAVHKKLDKQGIELNKLMQKKFKIGSWTSDGKDTYSGSLIKHGIVQTDVAEYKNTRSLMHSPIVILDLSPSGLVIGPSIQYKKDSQAIQKKVEKASTTTTNKPTNTGVINKTEIGNNISIGDYSASQLRSLPVGTDIYVNNTRTDLDGNAITISRLFVSIVDINGIKHYRVQDGKAFIPFGLEIEIPERGKPFKFKDVIVDDNSVYQLHSLVRNFKKSGVYMDTSKSIQASVEEKKSIVTEPIIEQPTILTAITEYKPSGNILGGVKMPNSDGSFTTTAITKTDDRSFDIEDLGDNRISLTVNNNKTSLIDTLSNPERILLPLFEGQDALNQDTNKITTTQPAILRKEGDKYVLESKGKIFYSEVIQPSTIFNKPIIEDNPFDINNLFLGDVVIGDEAPFRLVTQPIERYEPADLNKELKWLTDKLGDNIPVEITRGLIDVARSNRKAFGQLRNGIIRLSNIAAKGTVYHEAFHAVNLLYRTEEERQSTYTEARSKYNLKDTSDREVEEYLAEKFREYVINIEANKPTTVVGKILNWFKELYKLVKNIFTGNNRLTDIDIEHLFESIQNNVYLTSKPLQASLDNLLTEDPYSIEIKGTELENILNTKQYRSVIRGMASMAMKEVSEKLFAPNASKYNVIDVVSALSDLDLDQLESRIANVVSNFYKRADSFGKILNIVEKGTLPKEATKELFDQVEKQLNVKVTSTQQLAELSSDEYNISMRRGQLWQEIYDKYNNVFRPAVSDYIRNELNIKPKVDDDETIENKELLRFDKESYQYSAKDNILNSIKFLISNLHESRERNEFTGLHEFVRMDDIWSKLMADLHMENNVEDMIKILESKIDYFPYQQLASKLKNGSELLRTQFQVSFRKHRHSFLNAIFNRIKEGNKFNYSFYFTDADVQKASNTILRNWGDMFALSDLIKEDSGKIDLGKLNQIQKKFSDLKAEYRSDMSTVSKIIDTNPYKNQIVDLLRSLKIDVDKTTIDKILTDKIKSNVVGTDERALEIFINIELNYLFGTDSTIYKYAHGIKDNKSKIELNPRTLFKNEKVVKALAKAFVEVNPLDTSDTLPGPDGNNHYVYADNSYVTDVIRNLKEDDKFYNTLMSDVYSKYSYILNQIKDPADRSNLGIKTFNAILQEKTRDNGRGYLDMSPIEDFLFKMYAYENGYMAMPTLADRKSYYLPDGFKLPKLRFNDIGEINDEIIDIFYNYAKAERDRIEVAKQHLKSIYVTDENGNFVDKRGEVLKNGLFNKDKVFIDPIVSPTLLVNNYHYGDGKAYNIAKGLAFKYQLFSTFNREEFNFESDARNEIKTILKDHISATMRMGIRLGLVSSTGENLLLDESLITNTAKDYNGNRKEAIKVLFGNYTTNTMIATIESTMLFSGDPAFYKPDDNNNPTDDMVKRLSVLTSSGSLGKEDLQGEENSSNTYTVTTLSTPKRFKSTYYNLIANKQKELLSIKYPNLSPKEIDDLAKDNLGAYTKVDPADAEVYISPEMHRMIALKWGEWSDKKQQAYEMLNSTEPITPEIEQKLLNVVMQPLKYVYFDRLNRGLNDDNAVLVPTYDKMSLATLFRRYVTGTHMEDVLDRMESKGKYNDMPKIHMVKYDSAVKTGKMGSTELFKNVNTDDQVMTDLSTLSLYDQNFRYLRKQVVTDPHESNSTLLGTQAKKVGMANIVDAADYMVNGESIKGHVIKQNINNALSELSNKGLTNLYQRLDVDKNGNINDKLFQEMLYEEGKSAGLPETTLEYLRLGFTMDAIPEKDWIYSRVISMVNKNTIDTYLPGGQLIQVSGFGLGKKDYEGEFDKTNNLRFIFDENNKISGIEAKVSVRLFNEALPKSLDTFEKKQQWLQEHPKVFKGLGYRIPTQGQNSTIPITIKEFLPEQLGDVIILPNEFTALTGSDFDIDKLFFVRYNYSIDDKGNVSKVQLDSTKSLADNSKEAVQNYLLDHYRSVLLSENNFLSTSAPLGFVTDKLKGLARDIAASESKVRQSLDFASPVFQAEVKYKYSGGKFGVGPEALNNVHHVMCQIAGLRFNSNIGLGLVDIDTNTTKLDGLYGLPESDGREILISDWLSALIDSHVDIAKDPYIINVNVVKRTYNVCNLLIRIGMGQRTFEFLSQPVLKDLVSESLNDEGRIKNKRTIKSEKIIRDKYESLAKGETVDKGYNPFDDNLFNMITKDERNPEWYAKQVAILDKFMELDKGPAQDLNNLVMTTRVDTKKYGKDPIEIKVYKDALLKITKENPFINLNKLISLDPKEQSSFISTYYHNSIGTIGEIFSNKTITVTDTFENLLDSILLAIGRKGTNDSRLLANIADELHSAFVGGFFTDSDQLNLKTESVKSMMTNVVGFVRTYEQKYPELKDNYLLQSLSKGFTIEDGIGFIGIPGIKSDNNFTKEDLTYAWQELLKSDKPEVVSFAKQLLVYSYFTSGFKKGAYSLHHYIPAKLLKELSVEYTDEITKAKESTVLSYNDFVKGLIPKLSGEDFNFSSLDIIRDIFRNNWYNENLVPLVSSYSNVVFSKKNEPLLITGTKLGSLRIGYNSNKDLVCRPFISVVTSSKLGSERDEVHLMEYAGYIKNVDGIQPVYKLVSKRGYTNKGRIIKEYGLDKSILDRNNVTETTDDMLRNAIEKVPAYESLLIMNEEDRIINSDNVESSSSPSFIDATVVDAGTSNAIISTPTTSLSVRAEIGQKTSINIGAREYIVSQANKNNIDVTFDIGDEWEKYTSSPLAENMEKLGDSFLVKKESIKKYNLNDIRVFTKKLPLITDADKLTRSTKLGNSLINLVDKINGTNLSNTKYTSIFENVFNQMDDNNIPTENIHDLDLLEDVGRELGILNVYFIKNSTIDNALRLIELQNYNNKFIEEIIKRIAHHYNIESIPEISHAENDFLVTNSRKVEISDNISFGVLNNIDTALEDEVTNLKENIINDPIYSNVERQELLEVIDESEVLNEEDLSELIEKICNKKEVNKLI